MKKIMLKNSFARGCHPFYYFELTRDGFLKGYALLAVHPTYMHMFSVNTSTHHMTPSEMCI